MNNNLVKEVTDIQQLENKLSDSQISRNTFEDNTEVPEREITQTDHLNKRLLDAFLQKLNETGVPPSNCDSEELNEKINEELQNFDDNPENKHTISDSPNI